jgi:hypothetical protein
MTRVRYTKAQRRKIRRVGERATARYRHDKCETVITKWEKHVDALMIGVDTRILDMASHINMDSIRSQAAKLNITAVEPTVITNALKDETIRARMVTEMSSQFGIDLPPQFLNTVQDIFDSSQGLELIKETLAAVTTSAIE